MNTFIIEKANYTGYLWKSDSPYPEVLFPAQEYEITLDDTKNPFTIEGLLYDKDKKISYSIKYVDGKYIINKYDVGALNELQESGERSVSECKYLAHPNIGNNLKLKFNQYWKPVPDETCENLRFFKPAELVFTGFQKVIINSNPQK